jgi:O-antigen/teichoic acid export membrane protein
MAAYAGALTIIDGAWTLFAKIDTLLIGAFLGTPAVGLFQAPLRFTTFLTYPSVAVTNGVGPRLARHRDQPPNVVAFAAAIRSLIVVYGVLVAPLLVWAHPLADLLLGRQYVESARVLQALVPYIFLSGLAPLVSTGVTYLGEARRRVPIAIATVLINLVIDLALIPRIGIIAGAIGTDVAYTFYVFGHLWICSTLVRLPLRPLLVTMGRVTVAAAAMAVVLRAVGTQELSPAEWAAGILGGTGAFAAVLVATRELTSVELRFARGFLARRFTRRAHEAA